MSVYTTILTLLDFPAHTQGVHFWFQLWLAAKAAADSTPDTFASPWREFAFRCEQEGLLDRPDFRAVYQTLIGEKGEQDTRRVEQ